jgi:hypothetical protein
VEWLTSFRQVALLACGVVTVAALLYGPAAAEAVIPQAGQTYPLGTFVSGPCRAANNDPGAAGELRTKITESTEFTG